MPAAQPNPLANGRSASSAIAPSPPQACKMRLAGKAQEFSLMVETADKRQVPITVFAPAKGGMYPLAAFSHGAFAAPDRYRALLGPIAAAGFVVIAPMHVDSEEFEHEVPPSQSETWLTRNADMALALSPPRSIIAELSSRDLTLDPERTAAFGHSYGALIAQLTAGAQAVESNGSSPDRRNPAVDVVVGWSPPGPLPGLIAAEGWKSLAVPTLTITGTTDVFPGSADPWQVHTATFENAPSGLGALWVGEGIDHYFGGVFGREKPSVPSSQRLFDQALAVSLEFLERGVNADNRCLLGEAIKGETRTRN
ncbi:MAG: hypothetical protein ABJP70_05470 [Erythrobacter sp.]